MRSGWTRSPSPDRAATLYERGLVLLRNRGHSGQSFWNNCPFVTYRRPRGSRRFRGSRFASICIDFAGWKTPDDTLVPCRANIIHIARASSTSGPTGRERKRSQRGPEWFYGRAKNSPYKSKGWGFFPSPLLLVFQTEAGISEVQIANGKKNKIPSSIRENSIYY